MISMSDNSIATKTPTKIFGHFTAVDSLNLNIHVGSMDGMILEVVGTGGVLRVDLMNGEPGRHTRRRRKLELKRIDSSRGDADENSPAASKSW